MCSCKQINVPSFDLKRKMCLDSTTIVLQRGSPRITFMNFRLFKVKIGGPTHLFYTVKRIYDIRQSSNCTIIIVGTVLRMYLILVKCLCVFFFFFLISTLRILYERIKRITCAVSIFLHIDHRQSDTERA